MNRLAAISRLPTHGFASGPPEAWIASLIEAVTRIAGRREPLHRVLSPRVIRLLEDDANGWPVGGTMGGFRAR